MGAAPTQQSPSDPTEIQGGAGQKTLFLQQSIPEPSCSSRTASKQSKMLLLLFLELLGASFLPGTTPTMASMAKSHLGATGTFELFSAAASSLRLNQGKEDGI